MTSKFQIAIKRVFLIAGVLSAILFLFSAAIDVRSRYICDEFTWTTRQNFYHLVLIQYGRIQHSYPDDPLPPGDANPAEVLQHSSGPVDPPHAWEEDYRLT
jgi:hypothetical protein